MAREESDREDLLREATALVERIELAPVGGSEDEHVVAGFRRNGAATFFFGADPAYQFNAAGQLRRAYCNGQLIKAVRGRLVSLNRQRLANETQLLSRDLGDTEQREFMATMSDRLNILAAELEEGRFQVVGQAPAGADIVSRLCTWLAANNTVTVAYSPRVEE